MVCSAVHMRPINQIVRKEINISMKSVLFVIVALCVGYINSVPVRNDGLRYYRTPSFNGYYRPYPMHQTAMLLHYNNPYAARSSHASEITAFASGDRIGTGTYYEDDREPAREFLPPPPPPPPKPITEANEQSPDESNGNAVSIAEAYPEEDESSDAEQHEENENEVHFEPNPTISYEPLPQKTNIAPTAAPANPIVAQPPKINVEIETNEEEDDIVPVNPKGKQPSQGSWPLNTFFPISFGGSTSGGAIAIANSFSTGKGGTAVSRATAYGSSSKGKLKKELNH